MPCKPMAAEQWGMLKQELDICYGKISQIMPLCPNMVSKRLISKHDNKHIRTEAFRINKDYRTPIHGERGDSGVTVVLFYMTQAKYYITYFHFLF